MLTQARPNRGQSRNIRRFASGSVADVEYSNARRPAAGRLRFCKVNTAVLVLRARVLKYVEGSRLTLLAPERTRRETTLSLVSKEGISPVRVQLFSGPLPTADYLALYQVYSDNYFSRLTTIRIPGEGGQIDYRKSP